MELENFLSPLTRGNIEYYLVKNTSEMKEWLQNNTKLGFNDNMLDILAIIEMDNLIKFKLDFMKKTKLTEEQLDSIICFYFKIQ
jgi:hypothetical protein